MQEEIKEILDNPKILMLSYGNYISLDDYVKLKDYITNLQEYETIIEMEFKREYAKRYLEERRKEKPHLLYPDSDEIYKRYYELKEENERLNLIIRAIKKQCEVWEDYEMSEFIKQLENEKEISNWLKKVAGVDKE